MKKYSSLIVMLLIFSNNMIFAQQFFINHNSTSGVDGSAHLLLNENSTSDFSRLRFENEGANGLWTFAARATDGNSLFNFFYNDGVNFANIMSLDGDLFRVGIHQTAPDAFLHIKQNTSGVDALKFENDDDTGGEVWGWRVGDNDILLYFEGGLRASFNSDDGVYTNFPPSPLQSLSKKVSESVLPQVMQLSPKNIIRAKKGGTYVGLIPDEVEKVNRDWVVYSEDNQHKGLNYQQFSVISIKAIQEQNDIINKQANLIDELLSRLELLEHRIGSLED